MNAQELLTCAFNAITLGFLAIAIIDFVGGLMSRKQTVNVSPGQLSLFDIMLEFPALPDPWILQIEEELVLPHKAEPAKPNLTPLLLLPFAKEITAQPPLPSSAKPTIDELLIGVDLETLKLRPARKIASALGLAQKVNKRDLPLEWLRAQIKKRLEQTPTETAQVIKEILHAS